MDQFISEAIYWACINP